VKRAVFRRALSLVCYWADGRLVIDNYLARRRVTADPLVFQILNFFDDWKPVEALLAQMRDFTAASVRKAVADLARCSLLERSSKRNRKLEKAFASWQEWNPAGGFFHFSTKDVPFTFDPMSEQKFARSRLKRAEFPELTKSYPRSRKILLSAPAGGGELTKTLLERRTWREFSRRPVTLEQVGTLLGLTWLIQARAESPFGPIAFKTSPSGGARHPIEAYVVSLQVKNLARGIFHYNAERHCLELLRVGVSGAEMKAMLAGQTFFARAALIIFMTAVFAREQWKYPTARAYRVVQLDAGHLCQTFCLVATALGLAPFSTAALADTPIERALGIDGVSESVIYAAGVGQRPD
jgi:SagB-type dehydrogenase family enzyme